MAEYYTTQTWIIVTVFSLMTGISGNDKMKGIRN